MSYFKEDEMAEEMYNKVLIKKKDTSTIALMILSKLSVSPSENQAVLTLFSTQLMCLKISTVWVDCIASMWFMASSLHVFRLYLKWLTGFDQLHVRGMVLAMAEWELKNACQHPIAAALLLLSSARPNWYHSSLWIPDSTWK